MDHREMPDRRLILVLDDELGVAGSPHQSAFRRAYRNLPFDFLFESCRFGTNFNVGLGIDALRAHANCDLVLLDLRFGETQDRFGYEILRELTARFSSVPVLMMSSVERDVDALSQCLAEGAVGFVNKNQSPESFLHSVEQALSIAHSHVLLGQSSPLRELRRQAARLSPYDQIPVLIVGERGTGKERVARYIHHNGPRSQGPFVPMNCAGLADSLLEAELFGAEKGAYTGADTARMGYLERANGGVLLLDEIGNMPLAMQAKLLRVLQDFSFRRVGVSANEVTVDFQVLCATNERPQDLIREKRLREDLYDRLAAVTIQTPPLRECRGDIPELARHFLRELGVLERKEISAETLAALGEYEWPGNMRELRRVLQEAVVVSEVSSVIEPRHLPQRIRARDCAIARVTPELGGHGTLLPNDPAEWPQERLLAELRMATEARERVQRYKGAHWKAEFMRLMYPECKARNAKGFNDLVRRLTKGPWGSAHLEGVEEARRLLRELLKP
jgi:DNA-binding NtrC family response regulator